MMTPLLQEMQYMQFAHRRINRKTRQQTKFLLCADFTIFLRA